jgi:hypothetical protein
MLSKLFTLPNRPALQSIILFTQNFGSCNLHELRWLTNGREGWRKI